MKTVSLFATVAVLVTSCSSTPPKPTASAEKQITNVAGDWLLTLNLQFGTFDLDMKVLQAGEKFTCSMDSVDRSINLHADCVGSVKGSDIKLDYDYAMQGVPFHTYYTGTVADTAMSGTLVAKSATGESLGEGTFSAKRK